MLRLQRPPMPAGFKERAQEHHERNRQEIQDGYQPLFSELWREEGVKAAFSKAQYRKCGYCDEKITGEVGTIDHFRPKGSVGKLSDDPNMWGHEALHLTNVQGRKIKPLEHPGYWWLAYSWENWLFCCERCNSGWKRTLFPLANSADRALAPGEEEEEKPLLLNPFEAEDPANHLVVPPKSFGVIQPKDDSPRGFETIRTLGLNRDSLCDARQEKARKTWLLIYELLEVEGTALDEVLLDLYELGKTEYSHAGIVRIILKQNADIAWDELEAIVASFSTDNAEAD